jgi:RNA recognition motif-containing protein
MRDLLCFNNVLSLKRLESLILFLPPIRNVIGLKRNNNEKEVGNMEGSKLYVGNLKYSVTNEQLTELFSAYGEVKSVNIIEGKGFGFVEMSSPEEAEKAKDALNNTDFDGRPLKIDEARPPRPRSEYRRY